MGPHHKGVKWESQTGYPKNIVAIHLLIFLAYSWGSRFEVPSYALHIKRCIGDMLKNRSCKALSSKLLEPRIKPFSLFGSISVFLGIVPGVQGLRSRV